MQEADKKRCPYCQGLCTPSHFRPRQQVCSRPGCQRRRRRDYHRAKQGSDPEYRQVCLDSQKKWRDLHPGYQKDYRERHPEYAERNRQAQRARDRKRRLADLVKNSLALELKPCPGKVWLAGDDLGDLARNNLAFSQVLVLQTVGRAARASP